MSTGTVLRVRAGMKPIATMPHALRTIDVATGETASAHHQRSDVCAVPAAGVVAEAMVAIVLAEVVLEKFGGDSVARDAPQPRGRTSPRSPRRCAPRPPATRRSSQHDLALGERALVLIGPMGAGKTSIGRRVARALGVPLLRHRHRDRRASTARSPRSSPRTARRTSARSSATRCATALATGGVVVARRRGGAGCRDTRADLARAPRRAADGRRRASSPAASATTTGRCCTARTRSPAGSDLRRARGRCTKRSPTSRSTRRAGRSQRVVDAIVAWAQRRRTTEEHA